MRIFILLAMLLIWPLQQEACGLEEVKYRSDGLDRTGYLCRPKGRGPFPAVIYNHGGFGTFIGGAPEETCQAIAKAGFVGFSPIRRSEISMDGNLRDVSAAVEFIQKLPEVDPNRIGIIGFSRGGLLVLETATARPDLRAIILMAPAPGKGHLEGVLMKLGSISAPVLLLVAANDRAQADHVQIAQKIEQELRRAGKSVKLILYPAYGDDGHQMFFELGSYWRDVEAFLKEHL